MPCPAPLGVPALRKGPFGTPLSYEGLVGSLAGLYSRRVNLQHRFVYSVRRGPFEKDGITYEGVVKVIRMWTRYEGVR